MDSALTRILVERERLLARIGEQRRAVGAAVDGLATPIAVLDRALEAARYLRSHPLAVGIAVAAVVALRTRSLFGLAARGFGIWRLVRRVRLLARRLGW